MIIKQASGLAQNASQKDIEKVYTLFPKTTAAAIMRAAQKKRADLTEQERISTTRISMNNPTGLIEVERVTDVYL